MKKKVLLIITLLIVCLMVFVACSSTISLDGGFENYDENKSQLKDWKEYKYTTKDEKTTPKYEFEYKTIDPNSVEGKDLVTNKYITMNVSSNYGVYQLSKQIPLKKGVTYKLKYSINVPSDMSGNNSKTFVGAYVGLAEGHEIKDFRTNSKTGGWVSKELYFTVDDTDSYELIVGIGMEGKGARGFAMFDNITLESVESAPTGFTVLEITNSNKSSGLVGGITYTVLLAIFTVFICMVVYYAVRKVKHRELVMLSSGGDGGALAGGDGAVAPKLSGGARAKKILTSNYAIFSYVLLGIFFIRFIIVSFLSGMVDQLEDLSKVALMIPDVGLTGIYDETTLPINFGFMYILGAIGGIGELAGLSFESPGMLMLVRLPFVIGDLITFYLIYSFLGKHIGYKQSALVAGLIGILPMMFTASATWGMLVSITLPLIIGTVICMVNKKMVAAIGIFTVSMMINTLMIVLLPVMIIYGVYYSVIAGVIEKRAAKKKGIKIPPSHENKFKALLIDNSTGIKSILATVGSLFAFWLLSLPFAYNYVIKGDVFFIFSKAAAAVFTNPLVTNSVFNIFSMFGMGGATAQTSHIVVSSLLMVALIGGGVYCWLMSADKNRLDFMLISAVAFIGYSIFGVGVKFEMMLTGIVLLLIYAAIRGERRIFKIFTIYSLLTFINMGMLLVVSKVFGTDPLYVNLAYNNWFYIMCSVFAVLNTVYLFKVMYDIMARGFIVEIEPMGGSLFDEIKGNMLDIPRKFKSVFKK